VVSTCSSTFAGGPALATGPSPCHSCEGMVVLPMKAAPTRIFTEVPRAARNLVSTHGKNAARVADQRALNAELSGADAAAAQWRQIAKAIAAMEIRQ
jgi:hypothetical protein